MYDRAIVDSIRVKEPNVSVTYNDTTIYCDHVISALPCHVLSDVNTDIRQSLYTVKFLFKFLNSISDLNF